MTAAAIGEADFIRMFETKGALGTARTLGVGVRSVYERRAHLENKIGRQLVVPDAVKKHGGTRVGVAHPQRLPLDVHTGVVLVGWAYCLGVGSIHAVNDKKTTRRVRPIGFLTFPEAKNASPKKSNSARSRNNRKRVRPAAKRSRTRNGRA